MPGCCCSGKRITDVMVAYQFPFHSSLHVAIQYRFKLTAIGLIKFSMPLCFTFNIEVFQLCPAPHGQHIIDVIIF